MPRKLWPLMVLPLSVVPLSPLRAGGPTQHTAPPHRCACPADPLQRPSVQEVLSHPWTAHGLHPSVLRFNDPIVASSLSNPPSREVRCACPARCARCALCERMRGPAAGRARAPSVPPRLPRLLCLLCALRQVVDEIKSIVQEARALPESARCRPPLVPPAHAAEGEHASSHPWATPGPREASRRRNLLLAVSRARVRARPCLHPPRAASSLAAWALPHLSLHPATLRPLSLLHSANPPSSLPHTPTPLALSAPPHAARGLGGVHDSSTSFEELGDDILDMVSWAVH